MSEKKIETLETPSWPQEWELVGRGNGRDCFVHPLDSTKVIKLTNGWKRRDHQSAIEADYYNYLSKRPVSYEHVAACYGWVNTPKGRGLVFDRVVNSDGTPAITLKQALQEGSLTVAEAYVLLERMRRYLLDNAIVFVDIGLSNIVVVMQADGGKKLVIIDGLGGRRHDLKFHLRSRVIWLSKMKIATQWVRLRRKLLFDSPGRPTGWMVQFLSGWHLWWAAAHKPFQPP